MPFTDLPVYSGSFQWSHYRSRECYWCIIILRIEYQPLHADGWGGGKKCDIRPELWHVGSKDLSFAYIFIIPWTCWAIIVKFEEFFRPVQNKFLSFSSNGEEPRTATVLKPKRFSFHCKIVLAFNRFSDEAWLRLQIYATSHHISCP